jgi:hypothetical protein
VQDRIIQALGGLGIVVTAKDPPVSETDGVEVNVLTELNVVVVKLV